jgi:protein-disulfide isomerase
MSWAKIVACAALLGGVAAGALRLWVPERCAPPTRADKERLIAFVRLKHNLPSTSEIAVADGGSVFNSCFRRLVFATLSGRQFRAELFASPDFRFLTGDLLDLDARPNPKEAAERLRQTVNALSGANVPTRGSPNAPVTLAVFSDFQCPYCAGLAKTANDLAASEGDRLRILYHYFPLSMHHWALSAAEAAACAQRQGSNAFWSLHDFLFINQKELSQDNLGTRIAGWARTVPSLDQREFQRCVGHALTSGQVEQDIALGSELGVNSTPTVFINGEPVSDVSFENLKALIRPAPGANR